jgi:hypothetical protein
MRPLRRVLACPHSSEKARSARLPGSAPSKSDLRALRTEGPSSLGSIMSNKITSGRLARSDTQCLHSIHSDNNVIASLPDSVLSRFVQPCCPRPRGRSAWLPNPIRGTPKNHRQKSGALQDLDFELRGHEKRSRHTYHPTGGVPSVRRISLDRAIEPAGISRPLRGQ